MSIAAAFSQKPRKNDGSNLLHAGSVTSDTTGSLDFGVTNMNVIGQPQVSGLTAKVVDSGSFNVTNKLVSMGVTTSIAGSSTNVLYTGAGIQQKKNINSFTGYNRMSLDSFDILLGTPTYGSTNGDRVLPSGITVGLVGPLADTNASPNVYNVPHVLTYRLDQESINDNYTPRTL